MRTSSFLVLLGAAAVLGGCGGGDERADASGETIACQADGETSFEKVCTVERSTSGEGLVLTVHRPDGGFRRLLATKDGQGVIAADGAETAVVTIAASNEIEVALGGARYRLPATVKGSAPAAP